MKSLLKLLIPLLLLLNVATYAQNEKIEAGVLLGADNYEGDLVKTALFTLKETNFGYGAYLKFRLDTAWWLRLNYFGGKITGDDQNFDERKKRKYTFSSPINVGALLVEWEPRAKKRFNDDGSFSKIFTPYFFIGPGVVLVDPETEYVRSEKTGIEVTRIDNDIAETPDHNTSIAIIGGAGFRWDLTPKVNLSIEGSYQHPLHDYLDGISESGDKEDNDWYVFGGLTLGYKFGFGKDTDADGVKDKSDECPETPGLTEFNGCPDTDNDGIPDKKDKCPLVFGLANLAGCPDMDGDGITDQEDQCPTTPGIINMRGCPDADGDGIADQEDDCPTMRGIRSLKGCPDTDGDGIVDSKDKCPLEAGIAVNEGCPDMDTDGDGIVDREDACPKIAGIGKFKGCPDTDSDGLEDSKDKCPNSAGPISNDGCPVIKAEDQKILDLAIEKVQFDFAKSTLKKESFPILNKVADVLKKYPDFDCRIKGFTDNVGNDAANQQLSEQRANTCLNYLISRGIDKKRLAAFGYGETSPIADNNTEEGRYKNRRVEFEMIPKK